MASKQFIITTPVKGFNGLSFGVPFANGKGTTLDPWLAQRFKESGYGVTEDGTEKPVNGTEDGISGTEKTGNETKNLTGLDYNELKAKAKELGLEFPGNISSEKLKELLKEAGYEV